MKRKTKKYERFLILLKAVGNAHYVDKSRPYIQWTLADLFTDVIQNFLHSEKVNKSQTRKNQYVTAFLRCRSQRSFSNDGAKIVINSDICKFFFCFDEKNEDFYY